MIGLLLTTAAVTVLGPSVGDPGAAVSAGRSPAPTPSLFVAQSAAGSGDGSSCANAKAASFFNTVSNWGAGRPIAAGVVVGLCGTITSTLTAQGSGSPESPVTIYFTPGARLSQPACAPCLVLSERSFITVDGGSNGVIEGTDNGTSLGLHTSSTGLLASPCSNCEVKNLTIRNIYVHSGTSNEIDQTQVRSIAFNGDNFFFHNNVVHDAGWAINFGDDGETNNRIYNNDIYNVDHGVVPSFGTAGGSTGPYFIYGNHFHDFGNWDTANNAYHHDGIHCYTVAGGRGQHISDLYIYNNRFDGDIGGNATAWIFIEGGSGAGRTPCADATSRIWVFNNYGYSNVSGYNGVFGLYSGIPLVYNNTLVSTTTADGNVCDMNTQTGAAFMNNVCSTGNQLAGFDRPQGGWKSGSPDYNVYANGGANAFVCSDSSGTHFWSFSQFSLFQTCVGGESHSIAVVDAKLNPDGSPQATSPVLNAGANLRSLCIGDLAPLCRDIRGVLRPIRMAPDVGAFQSESAAISPRGVGFARLGTSRTSIERIYGLNRTVTSRRPLFGTFDIPGVLTATYRGRRGLLKVSYDGGTTVAVSTTSPYYTTPGGLGVGASAADAMLARRGWRECGRGLVRRRYGIATAIHVVRGRVVALTVSRSRNLRCP